MNHMCLQSTLHTRVRNHGLETQAWRKNDGNKSIVELLSHSVVPVTVVLKNKQGYWYMTNDTRNTCDVTHFYVRRVTFLCVTWLISTWNMSHVIHETCVTWLISMCDVTHFYMWRLSLCISLPLFIPLSLSHFTTCAITLQHAATCCNTLQHTVTHCNTLQHAAERECCFNTDGYS